jgi:hypothetical protein
VCSQLLSPSDLDDTWNSWSITFQYSLGVTLDLEACISTFYEITR